MRWLIYAIGAVVVALIAFFALGVKGMHEILKGVYCQDRAYIRRLQHDAKINNGGTKSRKT